VATEWVRKAGEKRLIDASQLSAYMADSWETFTPVDRAPLRIPTGSGRTIVVRPTGNENDVELSGVVVRPSLSGVGMSAYQVEFDADIAPDPDQRWRCVLWEIPAGALNLLVSARVLEDLNPEYPWQIGFYARKSPAVASPWDQSNVRDFSSLFGSENELTTGVAGTTVEPSKYSEDWVGSINYHQVIPFGGWLVFQTMLDVDAPVVIAGKIRLSVFYSLLSVPSR